MSMKNATLYDTDFYAWANEQAALLRAGRLAEADIGNIAEEIESIGRSERRELVNRLGMLLTHLLKWKYRIGLRGRSWALTIEDQRRQIARHLAQNPSLNTQVQEAFAEAYDDARLYAERETHLPRATFPPAADFRFEDAVNPDFWPD
jgi:hypothetical protein